jgi:large conductance mechanosensitive channel
MATKEPVNDKKNTSKLAPTRKAVALKKAKMAKERVARVPGVKAGNGFVEFLRTQGVIGLAVGLAIGTAAGATVKTLVEGFINPIVQFIVGTREGLEANVWHVELWGRTADFKWGAFVSSAITLVATAFVIYLIIHFAKLDRLDKKKES